MENLAHAEVTKIGKVLTEYTPIPLVPEGQSLSDQLSRIRASLRERRASFLF